MTPAFKAAVVAAVVFVGAYFFVGFVQQKEAEKVRALRRDGVAIRVTIDAQNERRDTSRSSGGTQNETFTCESTLSGQVPGGAPVRLTLTESGRCNRRMGAQLSVMVSRSDTSVWMLRKQFEGRDPSGHGASESTARVLMGAAAAFIAGIIVWLASRKK